MPPLFNIANLLAQCKTNDSLISAWLWSTRHVSRRCWLYYFKMYTMFSLFGCEITATSLPSDRRVATVQMRARALNKNKPFFFAARCRWGYTSGRTSLRTHKVRNAVTPFLRWLPINQFSINKVNIIFNLLRRGKRIRLSVHTTHLSRSLVIQLQYSLEIPQMCDRTWWFWQACIISNVPSSEKG